jgi:RNA polymerase sigma-70 factor (ECF subfamily)
VTEGLDDATLSALVKRAGAADGEALAALYRHFHRRALGLCRYLLGSETEAEDAASEVFARLPRAMNSYDSSLPFPRWLMSVTSHYCVDLLRKRHVEKRLFAPAEADAPEPAAATPSPLQELLTVETRDEVRSAVAALPERYRLPLTLRYYNEMSYDEIAATLELTRAHVATLIFRGKQELRRALSRPRPNPRAFAAANPSAPSGGKP